MRRTSLFLAAVMVMLAGCSEAPSAPTSTDGLSPSFLVATTTTRAADDAERDRLTQRVLDLRTRVAAAGVVTAAHQAELARLGAEVTAWGARTGRTDIVVSNTQALRRASVPTGTDPGCSACPIISNDSPGKVCFLKGIGPCVPVGDELWPTCYYICFDIATGVPDVKRR